MTPTSVPLLFTLLSDTSLPIRLATCAALLRIVSKGLKEPEDKLQLIKVLSLGQVIDALETKTREQQIQRGSDEDEGEESYREALGKLLNVLGLEIMKLIDVCASIILELVTSHAILQDCPKADVVAEAKRLQNQILPIMLRFMADDYDDTCSTVFPLLQTVLANVCHSWHSTDQWLTWIQYKRARKVSSEPLGDTTGPFLNSLLDVILRKMRWDQNEDPTDLDEDDAVAFDGLRKVFGLRCSSAAANPLERI